MFQQAMQSNGGTLAVLILFFIDIIINVPCGYITAGRQLWVISRDSATPFSGWLRHIDARHRNPFNAQVVCGICVTCLGAIYVGNATAFTAIIGSFTIFTTWSYLAAILPHMLSGRRNFTPGPFWMPAWVAYPVMSIACAYIFVFNILYMFPYVQPTMVTGMNYASVMTGGSTVLLTLWYLWKRNHGYDGPRVALHGHDDISKGLVGLIEEQEEALRNAALS
nr:putative amino-acid permease c15c4.04c [Quercus suber]